LRICRSTLCQSSTSARLDYTGRGITTTTFFKGPARKPASSKFELEARVVDAPGSSGGSPEAPAARARRRGGIGGGRPAGVRARSRRGVTVGQVAVGSEAVASGQGPTGRREPSRERILRKSLLLLLLLLLLRRRRIQVPAPGVAGAARPARVGIRLARQRRAVSPRRRCCCCCRVVRWLAPGRHVGVAPAKPHQRTCRGVGGAAGVVGGFRAGCAERQKAPSHGGVEGALSLGAQGRDEKRQEGRKQGSVGGFLSRWVLLRKLHGAFVLALGGKKRENQNTS
jgi:hypothetical protein